MNYRRAIIVLCVGILNLEAPVAAMQPASWLSTQDKRTILVAASAATATWGLISLAQKLYTRIHSERPQKKSNEQEMLIPGQVDRLTKSIQELKQENKELKEAIKKQAEQLTVLTASRSETIPGTTVATDTKK